ncbi:hypothetical protein [Planomonospora venezuelensis]|uniref:Uncharacterized protein n=1 Tax=Planomonospora venezuelensis TaxID=1999 RepID=A0A841D7M6_PLAVE|nr:hypothetical protein [Planomonospora venezuelensis]MBB5964507.1 hypothetical protein [Planomonospora venezuelensis]GIN04242.1 membrane protein [Planomonospora venezuelensis]
MSQTVASGADDRTAAPPLPNATRYLCAGAYLDSRFRTRVLDEILGDPYRAVAPSYGGTDLAPVVAHCLRAERMALIRDGLITALMVLLFLTGSVAPVLWLAVFLPAALLTLPRVRWGPWPLRTLLVCWAVAGVVSAPALLLSVGVIELVMFLSLPASSLVALLGAHFLLIVLSVLSPVLIALGYRVQRYLALAVDLAPGAGGGQAEENAWPSGRMSYVSRAQWGNIALYGAENPFVGAGRVHRSWSITVETDRTANGDNAPSPVPREHVRIDPADLHSFVRQRLLEMRDAVPSPPERVARLHISDHLAVRGTFARLDWERSATARSWGGQSHPLIDAATGLPHFTAPPETVTTAARHPQGGLRYYQRVTVGAEAGEVRSPAGHLLAPGEDQEIVVSAFIHLAVEGRMLYTQFVVTVLPPIRDDFHIVDELPVLGRPGIVWRALVRARAELAADAMFAPGRLVRALIRIVKANRAARNPARYPVYPFGARLSVRELGAEFREDRFTQVLDADKYSKLIERRLTEAVLDYLDAKDVDTSGYRAQAATLTSYGALITGGTFNGPVAAGTGAHATQNGSGK